MTAEERAFLSHVDEDKDFVLKLAQDLQEQGVEVWLDYWEIKPGDNFRREIHKALQECRLLLVILSPEAVDSDEVLVEIEAAIFYGKPIMPLLYKSCDIPYHLLTRHRVDFRRSEEYEQRLKELVDALRQGAEIVPPTKEVI